MTMIRILGVAALPALFAVPVAAPAPHSASQPDVSVTVESTGTGAATAYRIVLANATAQPVTAKVVQHLPEATTAVTARDGTVEGTTVSWAVKVGANSTTAVESAATLPVPHDALTTSACASRADGGQLLDCTAAEVAEVAAPAAPLWRRWLPYVVLAAALGVLGWAAMRLWKTRAGRAATAPAPRARRDVPWWIPVSVAMVGLLAVVAVGLLALTPRMKSAVSTVHGAGGQGWNGQYVPLTIGEPVSDGAAEFTVYAANCAEAKPGAKTASCEVTVSVRTVGGEPLLLYRSMQRLYLSDTTWVEADGGATAKANGGADVFAGALAPGAERLMTVTFTVPAGAEPQRLELREGAFARGVYLDLTS
ncbi:MAG: DUF4352 domain-containing protein [Hamadaea sp.]|nr:DUF4352 domain-containing protein [Hamadaea sp.]